MDYYVFSALINLLTSGVLAIFVLSKNWRSKINQAFALFGLSVAVWSFGYLFWQLSKSEAQALFWVKVLMAGAIFIPVYYLQVVLSLLGVVKKKIFWVLNYLLAFTFLIYDVTPWFVNSVSAKMGFPFWPDAGKLFVLFLLMFFGYVIYSTQLLYQAQKNYSGIEKKQIRPIFFGMLIGFLGGSTNYFLWYDIPILPIGNILVSIYVVSTAYAIFKHQLMNIKVIGTELLSIAIVLTLLVESFFSKSLYELFFRIIFLFVVGFFGLLLVRSVRGEVRHREETQRLATELKSANEKLMEIDHAKSDFLSIAAHQLRTPLSIIKGYISMVLAGDYGKLGSKKVQQVLNNVYKSNEHLIFLADDFLNVARLESGRVQYNFQETDLSEVVKQIVAEFEGKAKEKNLKLEFVFQRDLPKLTLDPEKIHHVVFNFLDNAIKYTEKGSVRVEISKEDDFVACSVTDTGIGMSHLDQENMFQKFYRGKNVAGLEVNGTGLGLYVSRRFIEAQGGKIWVRSRGLNKGSTFGITLPVKKE